MVILIHKFWFHFDKNSCTDNVTKIYKEQYVCCPCIPSKNNSSEMLEKAVSAAMAAQQSKIAEILGIKMAI